MKVAVTEPQNRKNQLELCPELSRSSGRVRDENPREKPVRRDQDSSIPEIWWPLGRAAIRDFTDLSAEAEPLGEDQICRTDITAHRCRSSVARFARAGAVPESDTE